MTDVDAQRVSESLDGVVGMVHNFPTQIPSRSVVVDIQQLDALRAVVSHHKIKRRRKYGALMAIGLGITMLIIGMNIGKPVVPKAQAQVLGVSSVSSSKTTSSAIGRSVSSRSLASSLPSSVASISQSVSSSSSVSVHSFVVQSSQSTQSQVTESSLYFANCSQAKAAGYHNIQSGEPGYRPALDRDKDGVACEN
jgi:Excalibur calcium-binding domain